MDLLYLTTLIYFTTLVILTGTFSVNTYATKHPDNHKFKMHTQFYHTPAVTYPKDLIPFPLKPLELKGYHWSRKTGKQLPIRRLGKQISSSQLDD